MSNRKTNPLLIFLIGLIVLILIVTLLILSAAGIIKSPMEESDSTFSPFPESMDIPSSATSDYFSSESSLDSIPITDPDNAGSFEANNDSTFDDLNSLTDNQGSSFGVLFEQLTTGETLKLGLKSDDIPDSDFIYLAPLITNPRDDVTYCFTFHSSRVPVDYTWDESLKTTIYDWPKSHKQFYRLGETYDTLLPADDLPSGNYGARWRNYIQYDGSEKKDANTTLYLRVYNWESHYLLGSFVIEITWNDKKDAFEISQFYPNDVMYTGALSLSDRNKILDATISELTEREIRGGLLFDTDPDILEASRRTAIVEKVPDVLYNPVHELTYASKLFPLATYGYLDIYAVTVQYYWCDSITFYYAPHNQLYGRGFNSAYAPDSNDLELTFFGYSAISTDDLYSYLLVNQLFWYVGEDELQLPPEYKNYLNSIGKTIE